MPMAYNTLVGFLGSTLSAGQQQRLLLARALYARPAVLLLDEATSHLDLEREKAVAAALRSLAMTRVIVAHRPETVAAADRIVRLEAGRLVPAGKHPGITAERRQGAALKSDALPSFDSALRLSSSAERDVLANLGC
jgi:ATP-binding cassette subfamily B protein RaxB